MKPAPDELPESADPDWFRPPNRRERWMGAALFAGFGLFFIGFYWVERHWRFAWILLILAAISFWSAARHAFSARPAHDPKNPNNP